MTKDALFFESLDFSYDATPVLQAVSGYVREGECVGVIGPNGGGKSTFLKMILGFLAPQKGNLEVLGLPPKEARGQMAYVPQNLRFDKQFPLTVLELVLQGRLSHLPWWGRFSAVDIEKAHEALAQVELLDLKDRPFGTLSGGQSQRALIARALVSAPKLLLLDEPTANVDSQAEKEIYALLKRLKGAMTILMVTHDLEATVSLFDRVLCLQKTALWLDPEAVCAHFALGLYHPPLVQLKGETP